MKTPRPGAGARREREHLVELTDEGYRVLEIVRRVLRERTHWATWGQTLMAAIEAEVQQAEPPAPPARPR